MDVGHSSVYRVRKGQRAAPGPCVGGQQEYRVVYEGADTEGRCHSANVHAINQQRSTDMSEKLPKALYQGFLRVGDVSIRCFVLDDGSRVVSGRGLTQAIGMKGRAEGALRIANHRVLSE